MIQSAEYYWVACDVCGTLSTSSSEHNSARADQGVALDEAEAFDWLITREGHWCETCAEPLRCPDCLDHHGQHAEERKGLCQACWEACAGEPETRIVMA